MATPRSSRNSPDGRAFKAGMGALASVVLLLVFGIFAVLVRESTLSIQKFGFGFWSGRTWDPVSGEFGALPFLWGTLYSSFLAVLLAAPVALGIAVFLAEICPPAVRQPLVFLTELL